MERLSLERWASPWLRHQHVTRYRWAARLARGRRALDAACGAAYGSRILLDEGAASVTSLDLSPDAFEDVRGRVSARMRLARADVTRLPLADRSHDVYLCFETIEHVEDDAALVREARRVLAPEGLFVCSTPNRELTSPGLTLSDRPENRYHVREYSIEEFVRRLSSAFARVTLFGQTWFSAAHRERLARAGARAPRLALRAHQLRKIAGVAWERPERHEPRRLDEEAERASVPEVIIGLCS